MYFLQKLTLLIAVLVTISLGAKTRNIKLPPEIQEDIVQQYKEISETDIEEMLAEFKERPESLKSHSYKTVKTAEKEVRSWLKLKKSEIRHRTKELLVIEHFGKADMRNPRLSKSISIWARKGDKWAWAHGITGKLWVFDLDKNGVKDLIMIDGCCGNSEIIAILNPTVENWDRSVRFGWGEMARPGKSSATFHFDSLVPKACTNFRLNLRASDTLKKIHQIQFDCKKREFSEASGS